MPKINPYDRTHLSHLTSYERKILQLYNEAIRKVALAASSIQGFNSEDIFSFNNYPILRAQVNKLLSGLNQNVQAAIVNGIEAEWTLANNKNSELARQVFGDNVGKLSQAQYRRYFSNNDTALQAFLSRKEGGLDLSQRVWKYTGAFKSELEMGLDLGIRNGLSAAEMTKDLRDYLQHPDKLFRRVRDEHGNLHISKAAADFHPGQGVYRSSYMNARRLAATETNIAYHTADYERWQQMDFVVGIEIVLSNNHNCKGVPEGTYFDICDELAGQYPKDFKFTGWHPHCRCHAITILKTWEEQMADSRRLMNGEEIDGQSVNRVEDVPDKFKEWVEDNKERAKGWSTMPYFIRENPQYVKGFEVDSYSPAERKFTRATKTFPAMKESLGVYFQSIYPDVPNTEKAAIYHFTRGDISAYRQLNNQLRKGELSEFNQAFSELLSNGLSKIEPVEQTVYRTLRLNKTKLRAYTELALAGRETTFKGFTSASTKKSVAISMAENHAGRKNNETDVLLVIKGKSGRPIEGFSQFSGRNQGLPNQHEVLFDKGRQFRFDKVVIEAGKMPVFYLTEL